MARWWRRGDAEPSSPQGNSAPAVTGSTSPAPVQRAAWQDLPPIRPTVTATRPVAPLDTFTASLATSHNPSFLAPLGHVVDPDGPSGHVDGLARPVVPQTVSSGPELAVAPRPSPVNTAVQRLLSPIMRFADNDPAPAPDPAPRPAAASLPPEQPAAATVDRPVRQLSSTTSYSATAPTAFTSAPVQDTATPRPVVTDLPVVRAAPSPSSMPTVSRHVADHEAEHDHSATDHSDHDHADQDHADHDHRATITRATITRVNRVRRTPNQLARLAAETMSPHCSATAPLRPSIRLPPLRTSRPTRTRVLRRWASLLPCNDLPRGPPRHGRRVWVRR